MPFAFIGIFLAFRSGYAFDSWKLILVVLCMVFARNAAMGFNRYLDRAIDAQNNRTKQREIPAGVIPASNALYFVLFNCAAFLLTTWFINLLCFFLAPVALLVILGYSYTKRFTALCHLVLGLGLSLAPIGAWLAVAETFALAPVVLGFAVLTWVSGFDIIYALQDRTFDQSLKLHSIPVWLGEIRAMWFSRFLHLLSFASILSFGFLTQGNWSYWIASAFYGIMLVYQHTLVKPGDLSRVNIAFMTVNGIVSVVFASIVIGGWMLIG